MRASGRLIQSSIKTLELPMRQRKRAGNAQLKELNILTLIHELSNGT